MRRRRWRTGCALLLALVLGAAAGAAAVSPGTVYIWRDASGAVRFTAPPSPR